MRHHLSTVLLAAWDARWTRKRRRGGLFSHCVESELRVEADEDTAPATKGDICRLENVMEQLVKRAPSFPTSQTETTQLDTSLKHKRKLLELMKNKDQAFDFSNAKVTAEQIYAFATLEADVLKEMTQYLIVSTALLEGTGLTGAVVITRSTTFVSTAVNHAQEGGDQCGDAGEVCAGPGWPVQRELRPAQLRERFLRPAWPGCSLLGVPG